MRKLTTEEFIEKAKLIHGDKYDYSKFVYIDSCTKGIIICLTHSEFKQGPNSHLRGNGCKQCGITNFQFKRTKSFEQFVIDAKSIHGDKYQYLENTYLNAKTKMTIVCSIHGEFKQKTISHLRGHGCKQCGIISMKQLQIKPFEQFLTDARQIHCDKYQYLKNTYLNNKSKMTIICSIHGEFKQSPNDHLQEHGCKKCGIINSQQLQTKSFEQFLIDARQIHGDKYQYLEETYINDSIKMTIICSIHDEFKQTPDNHLQGKGCPGCRESKGEKIIIKCLNDLKINCHKQFKFKDCKNKKQLPFDFYLPEYNLCIEYDGRQHFIPIDKWGGQDNLERIKQNDQIKTQYCIDNNIKLLRISYQEFKNIENILEQTING